MADEPKPGVLLNLAAEGIAPVLSGCAGALAPGTAGGAPGVTGGPGAEKAINFFGARIVQRWGEWFHSQPAEARQQALVELASMPPDDARKVIEGMLDKLALEPISPADRAVAVDYLSLLPGALERAMPRDSSAGTRTWPGTVALDEPQQLLGLMPINLPPYPVGGDVPDTPYRLDVLLGSGGFGAVYRASSKTLQHLPLAIKFCLDSALVAALHRERSNLERLMKAGVESWSPRVVRLYGYDLEHRTPYLVYEYVTGGDLIRYLAERREKVGRPLNPDEVFELVTQVVEALAFAHQHGLVHRDLKPANILVEGGVLKLADFGLGGVTAARAVQVSRIGATTVDLLTVADQASLFRGAGTPLYMAPEQRRGAAPDPRHDLYSLGVMWYQLLVGDVARELHPGWAKELTVKFNVPRAHIETIEHCVGWFDERPANAGVLLERMRASRGAAQPVPAPAETRKGAVTAMAEPADEMREALLLTLVREVKGGHEAIAEFEERFWSWAFWPILAGGVVFLSLLSGIHSVLAALGFGALVGAIVGAVVYAIRMQRRFHLEMKLAGAIEGLVKQYPEVVRGWGGEIVLTKPETVQRIARRLGIEAEEEPLPASNDLAGVPAAQRGELAAALRATLQIDARARPGLPRALSWLPAFLIAVALAVPAGMGLGSMYSTFFGPLEVRDPFTAVTQPYDSRGVGIDQGTYQRLSRQSFALAAACGVVGGLLIAGVLWFILTRWKMYRCAAVMGVALGAVIGGGAGTGTGFLIYGLAGPYHVRQPTGLYGYFDRHGVETDYKNYLQSNNRTNAVCTLAALLVGWTVGLVVLGLFQRLHYRRAVQAEQELTQHWLSLRQRFPKLFPPEVSDDEAMKPARLQALLEAAG